MARVARLSEELINKIAAGEVVERPASVVKELCENALDAGARSIRVTLEGGGLRRIAIVDDGHGMSPQDALLAIERHATSKLRDLEGLFAIQTMGFRGEALPSIASVSRFTLRTNEPGAEVATVLRIEGGKGPELDEAAPAGGTAIEIEDLFFNTPARKKFLKREETELKHAEEAVIRLALANPQVAFRLEHEGRVLFSSAAGAELPARIVDAIGPEVQGQLLEVDERRLGLSVRGFVGKPEFTLSNARGVYTFVNRRYIRDRGVNHAIQRAYQDALVPGRQPVAVLFLELDPAAVDVNVHPQKLEVRFSDPRGIHDAVHAAVGKALRNAAPQVAVTAPGTPAQYALAVERFLTRAQAQLGPLPVAADAPFAPQPGEPPSFGQARPGTNEAPPPGFFTALRIAGELAGRYWLCEGRGGSLVVIDPHAAQERAILDRLRRDFGEPHKPQPTLFAAAVEVAPALRSALLNRAEALARLGVRLEAFGGSALRIEGLPLRAEGDLLQELLTDLADSLPGNPATDHVDAYAAPLRVLACHAASAEPPPSTETGRRILFEALEAADFSAPTRHAAVVLHELPLLELDRRSSS